MTTVNEETDLTINAEVEVTDTNKRKTRGRQNTAIEADKEEPKTVELAPHLPQGVQELGIFKIDPENDFVVEFKTQDSACFDLAPYFKKGDRVKVFLANDEVVERKVTDDGLLLIQQGERALVPTGLIFDIPQGFCMEIYARSGTSLKLGIVLNNAPAQIDSDYVLQTFISIANTGAAKYLTSGNPIAQAKLVALVPTVFKTLTEAPQQKTDRIGGFGSTNK